MRNGYHVVIDLSLCQLLKLKFLLNPPTRGVWSFRGGEVIGTSSWKSVQNLNAKFGQNCNTEVSRFLLCFWPEPVNFQSVTVNFQKITANAWRLFAFSTSHAEDCSEVLCGCGILLMRLSVSPRVWFYAHCPVFFFSGCCAHNVFRPAACDVHTQPANESSAD